MSTEYNKDTYIGFLKMKKGGMKIIPGEIDTNIIEKRNKVLNHLELVLSGKKKLKEQNINTYFKALGGKYIRNDICVSGNDKKCIKNKNICLGGADKLIRLSGKKNLPIDNVLSKFKGSAPTLYEKLENKITGGNKKANEYNSKNNKPKQELTNLEKGIVMNRGGNYKMNGGDFEFELNKLRNEIKEIRN